MSIELESGLVAKTYDPRIFGGHLVSLSGSSGRTMLDLGDAVSQIESIFDLEEIAADRGIRKIMPTLLSHQLTLVEQDIEVFHGQEKVIPAEYLRPFVVVEPVAAEEFDPSPIEFMGQEMSRIDFLLLTHYILTNTPILDDGDPRLGLLEQLRLKYVDPTQ